MKKALLILTALAAMTLLSGCKDKVNVDYRGVDEVLIGQGDVQDKLPELKCSALKRGMNSRTYDDTVTENTAKGVVSTRT